MAGVPPEIDAEGIISGSVAGAGKTSRRLGVLLDGRYCGTLLAGRGFRWALPDYLVANQFELVELDVGAAGPVCVLDLRDHFRLECGDIRLADGVFQGWFASRAVLAEHVDISFRDGLAVFAQGLARRGGDGRHRFSLRPNRLMNVGTIAQVTAWIGGLEVPGVKLRVLPIELGALGAVDGVDDSHVSGWVAAVRGMPDVALLRDGEVVDTMRPRLNQAVPADRRGFFRLRRPPVAGALTVVLAGTLTQLCGSPVEPAPALQGFVERVSRGAAHGWARDPSDPGRRLLLEAVVDGEVLARAEADIFRGDVASAGHGDGNCGFRLDLSAHALGLGERMLQVRVVDTGQILAGSPRVIGGNPALRRFLARVETIRPEVQARLGRMMDRRWAGRGVSVVLRIGDTPPERLRTMLEALHRQWCGRWEALCVADEAPSGSLEVAQDAGRRDPRIRVLVAPRDVGLANAMDLGLRAAKFQQVLFLTSAACLEPDAVHHLLAAGADGALLYWDEAVTHTDRGGITDAVCRGAFSMDLFRGRPDVGTGFCLPAGVARGIGGWADRSAVDFLLAAFGRVAAIGHIPRIMARLDVAGAAMPGDGGTALPALASELPEAEGEVLIVIPTHNGVDMLRRCLDSIRSTTRGVEHRILVIDHRSDDRATLRYLARLGGRATVMRYEGPFNYAAMNNQAVRLHAGDARFVLFLNNDTEALHPGWLERLRGLAARPGIGAVGALLLYPDLRVQHAGVVLGVGGVAGHAFPFDAAYRDGERLPGPQGLLTALRDVSAVTAACMMMPVAAFNAVGGFDERLQVGFNDTDLCLRLRRRGDRVLYDGQTVLLHHESRTRKQTGQLLHEADTRRFKRRWKALLRDGDPYYSPHLSLIAADWELREACAKAGRVRFVRPDGTPFLTNM